MTNQPFIAFPRRVDAALRVSPWLSSLSLPVHVGLDPFIDVQREVEVTTDLSRG